MVKRTLIYIGAGTFLIFAILFAGWSVMTGNVSAAGGPFPNAVINTNIPGDPSSDVPGLPGVHFGPGSFDDDLFFDTFGNDDAHQTEDDLFYIVATVKDSTNTRLGQGLFVIDLSDGGGGTPTATATAINTAAGTATNTATATAINTAAAITTTTASATATATATATETTVPPTETSTPPTGTSVPPTETSVPPSATPTGEPPPPSVTPVTTGVELTALGGETSMTPVLFLLIGLLGLYIWLNKQS